MKIFSRQNFLILCSIYRDRCKFSQVLFLLLNVLSMSLSYHCFSCFCSQPVTFHRTESLLMEAEKGNFYVSAVRRRASAAKRTPSALNFAAELCVLPRRDKDLTPVASLSAINQLEISFRCRGFCSAAKRNLETLSAALSSEQLARNFAAELQLYSTAKRNIKPLQLHLVP